MQSHASTTKQNKPPQKWSVDVKYQGGKKNARGKTEKEKENAWTQKETQNTYTGVEWTDSKNTMSWFSLGKQDAGVVACSNKGPMMGKLGSQLRGRWNLPRRQDHPFLILNTVIKRRVNIFFPLGGGVGWGGGGPVQLLCWLWPWMVLARKVQVAVSVKDFTNDKWPRLQVLLYLLQGNISNISAVITSETNNSEYTHWTSTTPCYTLWMHIEYCNK